jgi:hypothetical protein
MTERIRITGIEDLTRSQRAALRRYLDPRMHIAIPIITTAIAIGIFVDAVLAAFGITPPLARWNVAILVGWIAIDWGIDLIKTIRSEHARVAKLRADR